MIRGKIIHGHRFNKFGGSFHLDINSVEDFEVILSLDEPYWMATSASINGFACDKRLFHFLDSDQNRRIRCHEIRAAISWFFSVLNDYSGVNEKREILYLDSLNTDSEDGLKIRNAALRILSNLSCDEADSISLFQIRNRTDILASGATNGDGIIPPEAASDQDTRDLISLIMERFQAEADAGGEKGITRKNLEAFREDATAFLSWYNEGYHGDDSLQSDIFPLGQGTFEAADIMEKLMSKLDEYFIYCKTLTYFDDASGETFKTVMDKIHGESDETDKSKYIQNLPLSKPHPDKELCRSGPFNPYFEELCHRFFEEVADVFFIEEKNSVTEIEWELLKRTFTPYTEWINRKPRSVTADIDSHTLAHYLHGNAYENVEKLIQEDQKIGEELAAIDEIEKVILYQRWLLPLVRNFVSFVELYDPTQCALFESGTLILDGRRFRLCLPVNDRTYHKQVARYSGLYLMYVKLTGKIGNPAHEIVVAVTSGSVGRICPGKKGVFYSWDGKEFDGEVVDIIKNPISLVEAFYHPFRRIGEILEAQIEKIIGRGEKGLESALEQPSTLLQQSVDKIGTTPTAAGVMPTSPADSKSVTMATSQTPTERNFIRDIIVGISLSLAAIGSSFAFITKMLSGVKVTHIFATLIICLALILGPIIILTLVKLHRRDVGMLLEASGWAINGRMRLTRKLCKMLTT